MQACESKYWQESIDSKALLVCLLYKLPYLLLMGVAGAVLGSGLYLLITVMTSEGIMYQAETEYYIEFAPGRIDGKDYYNDLSVLPPSPPSFRRTPTGVPPALPLMTARWRTTRPLSSTWSAAISPWTCPFPL